MGRMIPVILLLIILITFGNGQEQVKLLGRSSQLFAADVYKKISQSPGNILISPISVQTVLGLVQLGAKGKTLQQISRTLYLPINKMALVQAFQNMYQTIPTSDITLNLANKIYLTNTIEITQNYRNAAKVFRVEIEQLDLNNSADATEIINQWVRQQTNNKIQEIITEPDITNDTSMILVNALYFHGNWMNMFNSDFIHERPFYSKQFQNGVQLLMMMQMSDFNYTENDYLQAKFLELPYVGGDFVMTLVLPNELNGLEMLEKQISKVLEPQQMRMHETTVILPKFQIKGETKFTEILKQLGMKTPFKRANLSGMTGNITQLNINEVIQKTYIDVNEKGTEAAAVTGVSFENRFGNEDRKYFVADHPFLFIIKQKSTGIIEFLGRFVGP